MHEVQVHVFRILRTLFAHGVFDRPAYVNDPRRIDVAEHAQVATRIERSAITLLRNEHSILPLQAADLSSVAVIGPGAKGYAYGGGSSRVEAVLPAHAADRDRARRGADHVSAL